MSPRITAGLVQAALWIPMAAAVGTMAAVFVLPNGDTDVTRRLAVLIGLGFAALVGAVVTLVLGPRSSPRRANSRSYALVRQRILSLHAQFDHLPLPAHDSAELTEAKELVARMEEQLGIQDGVEVADPVDPSWVTGAGYQDLWNGIHRAEEALLVFASKEELKAAVDQETLRVDGSALAKPLGDELERITAPLYAPSAGPDVLDEVRARLRQIRRAINEWRDERWDGLVRARLRLVRSAVATAWTAFGLLVLALALGAPRDGIGACAVFFFVGALVGLVAQVRSDARQEEAVEDYGLASARLYQTVLASGLAAVAGVLLTPLLAEVAGAASQGAGATLTNTFNVALNPGQLIPAAIFGLSPQVLFDRLKSSADQYKSQLAQTTVA
jgi:hypothetical protein